MKKIEEMMPKQSLHLAALQLGDNKSNITNNRRERAIIVCFDNVPARIVHIYNTSEPEVIDCISIASSESHTFSNSTIFPSSCLCSFFQQGRN